MFTLLLSFILVASQGSPARKDFQTAVKQVDGADQKDAAVSQDQGTVSRGGKDPFAEILAESKQAEDEWLTADKDLAKILPNLEPCSPDPIDAIQRVTDLAAKNLGLSAQY